MVIKVAKLAVKTASLDESRGSAWRFKVLQCESRVSSKCRGLRTPGGTIMNEWLGNAELLSKMKKRGNILLTLVPQSPFSLHLPV